MVLDAGRDRQMKLFGGRPLRGRGLLSRPGNPPFDHFAIDSGFLEQPPDPPYEQGDFNYDGKIDGDDYFLIESSFLAQVGDTASGAAASAATRSSGTRGAAKGQPAILMLPVRSTKKRQAHAARKIKS
jgi:hypothetical protein